MTGKPQDCAGPDRAKAGANLVEALERQVEAYRRLLSLGRSKQDALVDGNVADLRRVVFEEQIVLAEALECEKAYAIARASLKPALQAGREPELGDITALLPADLRDRCAQVEAELSLLTGQLLLLTKANGELIRRARSFVEASITQLGRIAGNPTYDGSGSVSSIDRSIGGATLSRRL